MDNRARCIRGFTDHTHFHCTAKSEKARHTDTNRIRRAEVVHSCQSICQTSGAVWGASTFWVLLAAVILANQVIETPGRR